MRPKVFVSRLACGDKRSRVANVACSRVAFSHRANASSSFRAGPAECCDNTACTNADHKRQIAGDEMTGITGANQFNKNATLTVAQGFRRFKARRIAVDAGKREKVRCC